LFFKKLLLLLNFPKMTYPSPADHIRRKLNWMSRRLQSFNKPAGINEWTESMKSVFEVLRLFKLDKELSSPTLYIKRKMSMNRGESISITPLEYPFNDKEEVVETPKPQIKRRQVVKGKRLFLRKNITEQENDTLKMITDKPSTPSRSLLRRSHRRSSALCKPPRVKLDASPDYLPSALLAPGDYDFAESFTQELLTSPDKRQYLSYGSNKFFSLVEEMSDNLGYDKVITRPLSAYIFRVLKTRIT